VALTAEQLALLRGELGADPPPTDAELEEYHELRGGLVGVVRHVWSLRLAELIRPENPASFTVSGVYGQNVAANIGAIRRRLVELSAYPDASDEIPPGGGEVVFAVYPLERADQDR
jgi:hypothetical protein